MKSWPLFTAVFLFATQVAAADLPAQGMSMAKVEKQFGVPVTKLKAVGKPPITRWQYKDFIVVFEYRHVVQAVRMVDDKPATPAPAPTAGQLQMPGEASVSVDVKQ